MEREMWEYKSATCPVSWASPGVHDLRNMVSVLNELGRDRWDLVSSIPEVNQWILLLKRRYIVPAEEVFKQLAKAKADRGE